MILQSALILPVPVDTDAQTTLCAIAVTATGFEG
jgi:hypothetical protein